MTIDEAAAAHSMVAGGTARQPVRQPLLRNVYEPVFTNYNFRTHSSWTIKIAIYRLAVGHLKHKIVPLVTTTPPPSPSLCIYLIVMHVVASSFENTPESFTASQPP